MIVLLIAASSLLATCQAQALNPIFNFGLRGTLDFRGFNSLQAICQAAVLKGGVTDQLSDVMGQAVNFMMQNPLYKANPLALAGSNQKWSCLLRAVTSGGVNPTTAANGVADYFDTAPELRRFIPDFNPCNTVFCGEQGMTPMAMMTEIVSRMKMNVDLGRFSRFFPDGIRRRIPGMGTGMSTGMGTGMQLGQNTNPWAKAMAVAKQMMGGMGGMGAMGGMGGMGSMSGMGRQTNQQQPAKPASSNTSPGASGINPSRAGTSTGGNSNTASSQPQSNQSPSSASPPSPFNPMDMFNKMGSAMNMFNPPRQTSPSPAGTGMNMMQQMQKLQQMMNQFKGMGGSSSAGTQQATQQVPSRGNGFGRGMGGGMGMGMPGMGGMGMGMPGMPGMGMGGLPGMGSMGNLMSVMMMGDAMFDLPDPPAYGMGRGLYMGGMGMPGMGLSGMGMPSMGMSSMGMPGMGFSGMGGLSSMGMPGMGGALSQMASSFGMGMGGGTQPGRQQSGQSSSAPTSSSSGTGGMGQLANMWKMLG